MVKANGEAFGDGMSSNEQAALKVVMDRMVPAFKPFADLVADLRRQGRDDEAMRFVCTVLVSVAQGLDGQITDFTVNFKNGIGMTVKSVTGGRG